MNAARLLAGVCFVAGVATSQTLEPMSSLPRGAQDLASKPSPVNTVGWGHFQVAAATVRMPADSGKGLYPTAQTVLTTYFDMDDATGFVPQLEFRRSRDGGRSFDAPVVVHKLSQGEQVGGSGAVLLVDGHDVAIFFRSDVLTSTGGYAVLGYSSMDQGQTWNGPTLITPGFSGTAPTLKHTGSPSNPELRGVIVDGKIHLHYEALYTTTGAPNNEECFYARVSIDAQGKLVVEKSDVPVSNLSKPNESDIDNVQIAADGKVVVLLYQDQGADSNNWNATRVRISRDAGETWDAPHAITDFNSTNTPSHPSTDGNSAVAVSGNEIVVITEDNRDKGAHGRFDEVFADVSLDAGKTWLPTVRVSTRTTNTDVDDNAIGAMNGTFVISWFEDLGLGNNDNQNFVLVGSAAEIAAGSGRLSNVSLAGNIKDHQICQNVSMNDGGRLIVLSGECAGGTGGSSEASVISWSCDGGLNWMTGQGSQGERDVDDPYSVVTLNGDVATIYVEDFPPGGNNGNKVVMTGAKMPMLVNGTNGLELLCAQASAGKFALMLISGTGTNQGFPLLGDGSRVSLTVDPLFLLGLQIPEVFLASIDDDGAAGFPNVPDIKEITNADWYAAVVTLDPGKGEFLEFTDPLTIQ